MLNQHTLDIATFATQSWLIDPELHSLLMAQLIDKGSITLSYEDSPIHYTDYNWAYYAEAPKKNSIAVMTIKGVIYDYYAHFLVDKMSLMYADKNLSGLIIRMNSPGGSADAGYKIADSVAAAPFPTWCHIEYGQASSAGYMIATSCDGISASRPNDRVGSIGTYISYQDWSKYYEKLGIVSKDIYAQQSSEKNLEGREAAKGNFTPLENYVSQEAQSFIDYVNARRPSLNTDKLDPFKGRVFSATDALSIGLIDSIGDLKEAFKSVKNSTSTSVTPRTTNMLGFVKLAALAAVKGLDASAITEAHVEAINTELTAAGYAGLAVVSSSQLEKAVDAMNAAPADATALATAQAEVTRLTTELSTTNTTLQTAQSALTTAQNEVTRLGGLNGEEKSSAAKPGETQADAGDNDAASLIANLPHNKALEGNMLFN